MRIPDLTHWQHLSTSDKAAFAKILLHQLPKGFAFNRVASFSMGPITNEVALFSFDNTVFTFIPGAQIELGFDLSSWTPNPDELESWQLTADGWGLELSIEEQVESATLRKRTVTIAPLLMEACAVEVGWQSVSIDEPEVRAVVEHLPKGASQVSLISDSNREIRVTRDEFGGLTAELANQPTHESLCAELHADGFRYPTADEWEYACGAGSPTLFRWGNHVPCDRYPTSISLVESAWRRQWMLSGGKFDYPIQRGQADWDYYHRPNAFGLFIAENPYKSELLADPRCTRGGDGGCTICGGEGFFISWLTLATAYFESHACEVGPDSGISMGYTIGRRVLPLS